MVDDDGFLFLVDRVKDLIIVSGFNVYPAEVEEVIASHPAVAQVAVIGVPHPHSGEAVKAYVVVAAGASVEEDDIIHHCEAHLARYKCPQKVMFVAELPQSATRQGAAQGAPRRRPRVTSEHVNKGGTLGGHGLVRLAARSLRPRSPGCRSTCGAWSRASTPG